ncbi:BtrH N-terminal domain-containing protein [Clostridioides difficile]|nr:BtrH N-terminal domain-containing protein [Clostridioides difficile]
MRKLIEIKHHLHDYECMWNGIEDIYMNKMGESLPNDFFFLLSGFGSFCYMRTNKKELKRMVALGDGRTKKMYEFLAPIVGFEYKHYEFKKYEQALKKAKSEIDSGHPVVLGALDMYYLPYYEKLYHKEHIPFHYVLMVGYDDMEERIYLYDCGRTELLSLSYDELCECMNCSYPGLSKANTICTVRMNSSKNKYQIAQEALAIKRDMFLNPTTGFLGYKGFEKFIKELPQWKHELGKDDYDRILVNMVMFFGTVPTIPNVIKGIEEPDSVEFKGGFDKMSKMLKCIGTEYKNDCWIQVAEIFEESSIIIEKISNIIIDYLSNKVDKTEKLPLLFSEILKQMKDGYLMLGI